MHRGVTTYPMTYLPARPGVSKFLSSALVLLSATALSSLTPRTVLANIIPDFSVHSPLADGVYLYGQQPVADQPGSIYMVFEVTASRAVGAFYMPSSSFDCFSGSISTDRLDLTVIDSYEGTRHPYSLETEPTLAAGQAGQGFSIRGFTQLNELSDVDQQILAICQNDQAGVI